ncbi:hypothetical protein K431DRAFT_304156 [Polychaeton citri CBS 116435]|uniref:Uncharacterized protein n=1 Tax=Polychaeton citri CBS 116435 TaxID=1314669 RepID=A0A9P4UQ55_9PEZI|nr:hypothetical protein K431DRAFT_304156 [Polychaeton citri CBS 116435]
MAFGWLPGIFGSNATPEHASQVEHTPLDNRQGTPDSVDEFLHRVGLHRDFGSRNATSEVNTNTVSVGAEHARSDTHEEAPETRPKQVHWEQHTSTVNDASEVFNRAGRRGILRPTHQPGVDRRAARLQQYLITAGSDTPQKIFERLLHVTTDNEDEDPIDPFDDSDRNAAWYRIDEALGPVALEEEIMYFLDNYSLLEFMRYVAYHHEEDPSVSTRRFVRRYMNDEAFYINRNAQFSDLDNDSRQIRARRLAQMMRDEMHVNGQQTDPAAERFEEHILSYVREDHATLTESTRRIQQFMERFGYRTTILAIRITVPNADWFLGEVIDMNLDSNEETIYRSDLTDQDIAARIWYFLLNPQRPPSQKSLAERRLPRDQSRICDEHLRQRFEHRAILREQLGNHVMWLSEHLTTWQGSASTIVDVLDNPSYNWALLYALVLRHMITFGATTLREHLRRHSETGSRAIGLVELFENDIVRANLNEEHTNGDYERELELQYNNIGRRHAIRSNHFEAARAALLADCLVDAVRGDFDEDYVVARTAHAPSTMPPQLARTAGAYPQPSPAQLAKHLSAQNQRLNGQVVALQEQVRQLERAERDCKKAKRNFAAIVTRARDSIRKEIVDREHRSREETEAASRQREDVTIQALEKREIELAAVQTELDVVQHFAHQLEAQWMEYAHEIETELQQGREAMLWRETEGEESVRRLETALAELDQVRHENAWLHQTYNGLQEQNGALQHDVIQLQLQVQDLQRLYSSRPQQGGSHNAGVEELRARLAECMEHGRRLAEENNQLRTANQLLYTQRVDLVTARGQDRNERELLGRAANRPVTADRTNDDAWGMREAILNSSDQAGHKIEIDWNSPIWRAPSQGRRDVAPEGTLRRASRDLGAASRFPPRDEEFGYWLFARDQRHVQEQAQILLRDTHLVPHREDITPEDLRRAELQSGVQLIPHGLVWMHFDDAVSSTGESSSSSRSGGRLHHGKGNGGQSPPNRPRPSSTLNSPWHPSLSGTPNAADRGSTAAAEFQIRGSPSHFSSLHSPEWSIATAIAGTAHPLDSPSRPSLDAASIPPQQSLETTKSYPHPTLLSPFELTTTVRQPISSLADLSSEVPSSPASPLEPPQSPKASSQSKRKRRPSIQRYIPSNTNNEEDSAEEATTDSPPRKRKKRRVTDPNYVPTTPTRDSDDGQLKTPQAPRRRKVRKVKGVGKTSKLDIEGTEAQAGIADLVPANDEARGQRLRIVGVSTLVQQSAPASTQDQPAGRTMVTRAMDGTRKRKKEASDEQ